MNLIDKLDKLISPGTDQGKHVDNYKYIDVNITGNLNILEYCRENGLSCNYSAKTKLWFIKERIKYYVAVSKIKEKIKSILRKIIPRSLISKIRGN